MFEFKKVIEAAIRVLKTKTLFEAVPNGTLPEGDGMSFQEKVSIWKALDQLEDAIKGRKEALRQSLLAWAAKHGAPTDKGGQVYTDETFTVTREKRGGKMPEDKPFRELLKKKEIPLTEAFDEVKALVYSPSKVKYLIDTGKLTEAEVEGLKKVDYALKVAAPEDFDQIAF